jgi:hypothetical protein
LILGSPETNVDTDENRHDFIDKFQRLKQQVLDGTGQEKDNEKSHIIIARTIFTSDTISEKIITVGNWTFKCHGSTQLQIHNIEGEQVRLNLYTYTEFNGTNCMRLRNAVFEAVFYPEFFFLEGQFTTPGERIRSPNGYSHLDTSAVHSKV